MIEYPREIARLHSDLDGNRFVSISSRNAKVRIRIGQDGIAEVLELDWNVPVINGDPDARRPTCAACEHMTSMGELTVSCKLCGCGGLKLNGPASLCRAGKW